MAREIKETPVLKGQEADRFTKATKENESKRVSIENYRRAVDNYDRITRKQYSLANQLTLRRLEPDETRPVFDCGNNDLNEFFAVDSKSSGNELLSVTYVAELDDKVVLFFSVSNDSIKREELPSKSRVRRFFSKIPLDKRYKSMPAVKIGRFATCTDMQCKHIGTDVIDYIKVWFTRRNKTGCRFIIVDAHNIPRTIKFYKKNDFEFLLNDEDESNRLMYFDLIKFRE